MCHGRALISSAFNAGGQADISTAQDAGMTMCMHAYTFCPIGGSKRGQVGDVLALALIPKFETLSSAALGAPVELVHR